MLAVGAIIATRNRSVPLARTLASLAKQSVAPDEIVIVDASDDDATRMVCEMSPTATVAKLRYVRANARGAASQRNEGVARAAHPFVLFLDDDILLEPDCLARMCRALTEDTRLGGVGATISNQQYHPPGRASRLLYRLLHGRTETSYAGRVLGPGMNLLPEDRDDLPEVVSVEWLNTTCTLYRRDALPEPPFQPHFTGYSLGEDLALSLRVAQRGWQLANARTARIFHDSQPGEHKNDPVELARMELVNRHYIMTEVLGRRSIPDYVRLGLLESFFLIAGGRKRLLAGFRGKLRGLRELRRGSSR